MDEQSTRTDLLVSGFIRSNTSISLESAFPHHITNQIRSLCPLYSPWCFDIFDTKNCTSLVTNVSSSLPPVRLSFSSIRFTSIPQTEEIDATTISRPFSHPHGKISFFLQSLTPEWEQVVNQAENDVTLSNFIRVEGFMASELVRIHFSDIDNHFLDIIWQQFPTVEFWITLRFNDFVVPLNEISVRFLTDLVENGFRRNLSVLNGSNWVNDLEFDICPSFVVKNEASNMMVLKFEKEKVSFVCNLVPVVDKELGFQWAERILDLFEWDVTALSGSDCKDYLRRIEKIFVECKTTRAVDDEDIGLGLDEFEEKNVVTTAVLDECLVLMRQCQDVFGMECGLQVFGESLVVRK